MSNSGTIQAANNASIKAVNLTNTSQIAADSLRIETDKDLSNIGGQISANTALNIQAGGDIIGKSTTVTGTGTGSGEAGAGVYSATVLDRAASFNVILGCAGGAATAGNGSGCAPGAVGAVVGEMSADYAKNTFKMSDADALSFAKIMSATSGVLTGGGDAAAVNIAATMGANAAENNTLFHYKGKIIARDGKNNDKVIDLSVSDLQSIAAQESAVLTKEIAGLQSNNINLPKISDTWADQVPNSTTYDLDNAKDRSTLQGKTDMGYINIDNTKTRVYLQTGMQTQPDDAIQNAQKVADVMRVPVGAIVNGTQGLPGDVDKFLPNNATLSDALNEYTYRTLNDKGPTLIITHSAGNNDATKAMQLGAQLGNTYPNLSLMSLASPISDSVIKTASGNTGVNYLGQVNDWRDPVTNPTLWVIGAGAMLAGGAAAGVALAPATGGGSLYSYFTALIGGGIGGGIGVYGINNYHPLEQYITKPGAKSIMFDWQKSQQK